MRVADVLEQTGLPFTEVAFNNPPCETYAVYNEEITRRGADLANCITKHDVTVEVYSYDFYDSEAVQAVARTLDRFGLEYMKYETTFVTSEHLYCTSFEISFIEKGDLAERDLPSEW